MRRIPFHTIDDANAAAAAVRAHLECDGIIAYPTETVYGFGCALRPAALARLKQLKGREGDRPFLLLHSDPRSLDGLHWNDAALVLANAFWPGPLTLAVEADAAGYPDAVRSRDRTVAVRQTSQPAVRELLAALDDAITSTSANEPGAKPATSADEVEATLRALDAQDVLILDGGPIPVALPSTIVDCSLDVPRVLRAGAVSADELQRVMRMEGFAIDVG